MSEETTVDETTENIAEQTVNEDPYASITVDDYKALEVEKLRLENLNKQLYARAKKTEPLQNKQAEPQDIMDRVERLVDLKSQGYTKEDLAFLEKNGGNLEDPYVKAALDSRKQQRLAEQAATITSGSQSDIERKYSNSELKGMSAAELEKLLPHA